MAGRDGSGTEAAGIKKSSLDRLERALREVELERGGGGRLSLAAVCKRAGVSLATGNRAKAFLLKYKAYKHTAGTAEARGAAAGSLKRRDRVRNLTDSVKAFANVVACLNITVERQAKDIGRHEATIALLREQLAAAPEGNVVAFGPVPEKPRQPGAAARPGPDRYRKARSGHRGSGGGLEEF